MEHQHCASATPVSRPDAHPRPSPPRSRPCRIRRALQRPPSTPLSRPTRPVSTRHASSGNPRPRHRQATKNRSPGWPRPRIPDSRLSWTDDILGTHKCHRRKIKHLAHDPARHLRIGEVVAAALTGARRMDLRGIGIGALREVASGVPGLLPRLLPRPLAP